MSEDKRKTILLVEDEAIIAVAQKMTLEKYGYNIITAVTGEKAIEVFKDNSSIDLVLMDIDLGEGIDGTETAEIILNYRAVPLVFLSSHTEPAVVRKTENITSFGYVVKNSGITVLDASIKMAFKLFYAHDNIQSQKMEMEALYEEMEASNEELEALNEELVRTGNEIMESEARFKALHNASFGGIAIHDMGIILECNQGLSDMSGYSVEELVGMNGLLLISEKTRDLVLEKIKAGYEKPYEAIGVRKNGEEYPIRLEARNVPYKGKMVRTVEFRDLTEIKRIENILNSERDRAAKYLEVAGVMMMALDCNGVIKMINRKGCEILGGSREEILGLNWFDTFIPGAMVEEIKNVFKMIMTGEIRSVEFYENKLLTLKGEERLIAWHNTILYNSDGSFEGILSSGEDITDRKSAEETLIERQNQLSILSDNLPGGFVYQVNTGKDGKDRIFTYLSSGIERLHGVTASEVMKNPMALYSQFVEEDQKMLAEREETAILNMTQFVEEARIRKPSGEIIWVYITSAPRRLADNTLVWDGIEIDITDRKLSSENLRQNEFYLKKAQSIGKIGHFSLDPVTNHVEGSDELFRMFDIDPDKPLFEAFADSVHPEDGGLIFPFIERALKEGIPYDVQHRVIHRDGTVIYVNAKGEIIDTLHGPRMVGIIQDITERKIAEDEIKTKNDQLKTALEEMEAANEELTAAMEELDAANEELIATAEDLQTKELALRESEKKFKAIIDTLPLAIHLTTGIEQVTQYVNPTMVELFGYTMEDIPSVAEWWPLAYPDEEYRRKISEEWNERVIHAIETQTSIEPMEVVVNCKDGSKKNISWGYITLGDKNYSCGLDLTDRIKAEEVIKLDEARLESLLSINQHSTDNIQNLLDYTLAEAIKLTGSKIGYIYFYDEDREEFSLNTWSKDVMKQCAVVEKQTIYMLSKTGLWGEAVRQRQPIMVNDFEASNIYKKGLPEGHNPLKKYLTIPVFSNEHIVSVVGVANKETDYSESDIRQLNLMMDAVWKIVQRKQVEDEVLNLLSEKELLLKEVHHRIKNNMGTISNLLRIQGEDQDNPEIKKVLFDAEGRVLSMMVLYDKLYRSPDFEKMSVSDYLPVLIDEILANFPDKMSVKIEKQIDDFILDVKILQPLGIIINELLTNTMKYAFSGRSSCKITISANLTGRKVSIVIQDNGKGLPESFDQNKPAGFGMQLVSILTEQIGGHIRVERGEGTKFVLEFDIV